MRDFGVCASVEEAEQILRALKMLNEEMTDNDLTDHFEIEESEVPYV
ncbi:MAG: hypothetical protein PUK05_02310 [Peptoniphilaceae bacterium]|nr:hypothetical protein [Peptoniphilaceae bacterium]